MATPFEIPYSIAESSDYQPLASKAENRRYGSEVSIYQRELTDGMVEAIRAGAEAEGNRSFLRIMEAIQLARAGEFDKSIPNLLAAPEMVLAYFRANLKDGWVYKEGSDGHMHAWLVTEVAIRESRGSDAPPFLAIDLIANGQAGPDKQYGGDKGGLKASTIHIDRAEVTRKKVTDMLLDKGLYVETPDLRADYDEALEEYTKILNGGFAEQFRFQGKALKTVDWKSSNKRHTKVIHDLAPNEVRSPGAYTETVLFETDEEGVKPKRKKGVSVDDDVEGTGAVPIHFEVRVFDLAVHDFLTVNSRDLTWYEYDATLRDKIVLPEDQRNLLDILTSDLNEFTADIIEGKSIGNVVLCKGEPGVGKTLTAEVYAELIKRPLYSIHSGNLGINAKDIRENLEQVFQRAKRWNVVLLLDEADVFVLERGDNIEQNAIVAEFLRTLEYFDGLMFMTTNRAKNIDDAILSRAAAIIDYKIPAIDAIRAIWTVQMENQGYKPSKTLMDSLVGGFAEITGRDVKMLLRLCLRVARKNNKGIITDDIVASCAMFRGLHFEPGSRVA